MKDIKKTLIITLLIVVGFSPDLYGKKSHKKNNKKSSVVYTLTNTTSIPLTVTQDKKNVAIKPQANTPITGTSATISSAYSPLITMHSEGSDVSYPISIDVNNSFILNTSGNGYNKTGRVYTNNTKNPISIDFFLTKADVTKPTTSQVVLPKSSYTAASPVYKTTISLVQELKDAPIAAKTSYNITLNDAVLSINATV